METDRFSHFPRGKPRSKRQNVVFPVANWTKSTWEAFKKTNPIITSLNSTYHTLKLARNLALSVPNYVANSDMFRSLPTAHLRPVTLSSAKGRKWVILAFVIMKYVLLQKNRKRVNALDPKKRRFAKSHFLFLTEMHFYTYVGLSLRMALEKGIKRIRSPILPHQSSLSNNRPLSIQKKWDDFSKAQICSNLDTVMHPGATNQDNQCDLPWWEALLLHLANHQGMQEAPGSMGWVHMRRVSLILVFIPQFIIYYLSTCDIVLMRDCPCEIWTCTKPTPLTTAPPPRKQKVSAAQVIVPTISMLLTFGYFSRLVWRKWRARYRRVPSSETRSINHSVNTNETGTFE